MEQIIWRYWINLAEHRYINVFIVTARDRKRVYRVLTIGLPKKNLKLF